MSNRILLIAHAPLAHAMQQCAAHVFPDSDAFLMALDIAADADPVASREEQHRAGAPTGYALLGSWRRGF